MPQESLKPDITVIVIEDSSNVGIGSRELASRLFTLAVAWLKTRSN
jgi:hypothetical protein